MSRAFFVMFSATAMALLAVVSFDIPSLQPASYGFVGPELIETRILFVGDVMLGRYVETLIKEEGESYLFEGLRPLVARYDKVIGNFEAPITINHTQTEPESLMFSIASTSIESLGNYFSTFSLANNHTFDQGEENLIYSQATLEANDLEVFGHPNEVAESSVTFINHGEEKVAMIGLNAVGDVDTEKIIELLDSLESSSAMQIVYVHWGEEYEGLHSESQEVLAHLLIDNGADAIVGHHPHVVQDIGLYKGSPIFYSLGNFIFDQYFSDDVQVGLGVELELINQEVTYRLVPFSALEHKSSPRLMTISERQQMLDELSSKSSPNIAEKLRQSGTIFIADTLASL